MPLPGVMTIIKDRFICTFYSKGGLSRLNGGHMRKNTHNTTPFYYRRTPSQITVSFKGR